jgi:hypothetical protein
LGGARRAVLGQGKTGGAVQDTAGGAGRTRLSGSSGRVVGVGRSWRKGRSGHADGQGTAEVQSMARRRGRSRRVGGQGKSRCVGHGGGAGQVTSEGQGRLRRRGKACHGWALHGGRDWTDLHRRGWAGQGRRGWTGHGGRPGREHLSGQRVGTGAAGQGTTEGQGTAGWAGHGGWDRSRSACGTEHGGRAGQVTAGGAADGDTKHGVLESERRAEQGTAAAHGRAQRDRARRDRARRDRARRAVGRGYGVVQGTMGRQGTTCGIEQGTAVGAGHCPVCGAVQGGRGSVTDPLLNLLTSLGAYFLCCLGSQGS